MKKPVTVTITGAAGNIGYALAFRVASGQMLGVDQPINLNLLEIPAAAISLGTPSAGRQELELALFSAASYLESATNDAQVCTTDEFAQ